MKKIIKAIGIIAILGSVAVASTSSVTTEVSKKEVKDATTVQFCDALMRLMGICRSSQTPLSEY